MAVLTQGTWVVVADGEKALFLRNDMDAQNPNLNVVSIDEQENPSDYEQSANRPGRMNDNGPGQKSALDDTDWHQLAKDRFASDIADKLYKLAHKGKFDEIVVVAPPQTLGELRKEMHQEVSDTVIAEIPKTLTNHPIDKIEELIKQELAGFITIAAQSLLQQATPFQKLNFGVGNGLIVVIDKQTGNAAGGFELEYHVHDALTIPELERFRRLVHARRR